jgi:hypothetical protein
MPCPAGFPVCNMRKDSSAEVLVSCPGDSLAFERRSGPPAALSVLNEFPGQTLDEHLHNDGSS